MKSRGNQVSTAKPADNGAGALAIEKVFDFTKWVMTKVDKFPRSYKSSLGNRLIENSLDLLSNLVEAANSHRKATVLAQAGRKVNMLRYLMRLCRDKNILPIDQYQFAIIFLHEFARVIEGWKRYGDK
jgi:hypothetical protein